MALLARRNLFHDRIRFAVTLTGIVFALDEPSERVDTKVLEPLMLLDPGQKLPIGLRVDAYVQPWTQPEMTK
jgi:hypothetical protein